VSLVRSVGEGAHVVEVGDVELVVVGLAAVGADFFCQRGKAVGAAGAEDDVVAVGGEPAGGRFTRCRCSPR
jgi:hypothetical protein